MGRRWLSMLAAAQLLVLVCGCTSQPVQVAQRPTSGQQVGAVARGRACGVLVFDVIPAGINMRTERAYNRALGGHRGLVDTEIQDSWYFIGVGDMHCTTVEGKVID
jgi:hypothetical protein